MYVNVQPTTNADRTGRHRRSPPGHPCTGSTSTRRSSAPCRRSAPGTTDAASPRSMKPTSPPSSSLHRRRSPAGGQPSTSRDPAVLRRAHRPILRHVRPSPASAPSAPTGLRRAQFSTRAHLPSRPFEPDPASVGESDLPTVHTLASSTDAGPNPPAAWHPSGRGQAAGQRATGSNSE